MRLTFEEEIPSEQSSLQRGSLHTGLDNLGVGWLSSKVGIVLIATLAGLGVAHALPYLYDPIFGRLVSSVVGTEATPLRDQFTEMIMTGTTFLAAFLVAYFPDRILRYVRRAAKRAPRKQQRAA